MAHFRFNREEIAALHSEGLSPFDIADRLDITLCAARKRLSAMGLKPNPRFGLSGEPPVAVDEYHSLCNRCNAVVRNDQFPWVAGRADGRRLSYCRVCRAAENRRNLYRSPESYWRDKESKVRRNPKKIAVNLSKGHLLQRWNEQGGLCFYTDEPIVVRLGYGRGPGAPSVDRIDTTRGYEDGNIALCTDRVNRVKYDTTLDEMRDWMPGWYERAKAYMAQYEEAKCKS